MNAPNPSKPANGIGLRFDDVNFKRVLVPVDFSVCTLETLRYAKALVEKYRRADLDAVFADVTAEA